VFLNGWGQDTVEESNEAGQVPALRGSTTNIGPDTLDFSLAGVALTHQITGTKIVVSDSTGNMVTHNGLEIEKIAGSRGFDLFDVTASGDQGLQLDGGRGSDKYVITSSSSLRGPVLVQDTGPVFNYDTLVLNGTAGADVVKMTDRQVSFVGGGASGGDVVVSYRPPPPGAAAPVESGLEQLEINTLAGNDQIAALSTPAGMTVVVDAGAGNDVINVGADTNGTVGTLNNISGNFEFGAPLLIKGEGEEFGGEDTLNLFDNQDTTDNVGEMSARNASTTRITGLGMSVPIDLVRIDTVNLRLGSGNDTFTVSSTARGEFNLYAGAGDDTINVREVKTGTDKHNGAILDGEGGNDTFNLGDKSPEPFLGVAPAADGQGSLNKIKAPLTVRG